MYTLSSRVSSLRAFSTEELKAVVSSWRKKDWFTLEGVGGILTVHLHLACAG
jgi:hypothetical protein